MFSTPFPERYEPAVTSVGGDGTWSERWKFIKTGEVYAVNKYYPASPTYLFDNEVTKLQRTGSHGAVGVVGLHDSMEGPDGSRYVLTTLPEGVTLEQHMQSKPYIELTQQKKEMFMLHMAAQVLQSLGDLHTGAGVAHMNISPQAIMLQRAGPDVQTVMFDFTLAQPTTSWVAEKDAIAYGYRPEYAPPEVIGPALGRKGGMVIEKEACMVNGSAADIYSLGVLMYKVLTGRTPFQPKFGYCHHFMTETSIVRAQRSWAQAVAISEQSGQPVHHGLLTEVRAKSTNPQDAEDFFTRVLHPDPQKRLGILAARYHTFMEESMGLLEVQQAKTVACIPTPASPTPFSDITNTMLSTAEPSKLLELPAKVIDPFPPSPSTASSPATVTSPPPCVTESAEQQPSYAITAASTCGLSSPELGELDRESSHENCSPCNATSTVRAVSPSSEDATSTVTATSTRDDASFTQSAVPTASPETETSPETQTSPETISEPSPEAISDISPETSSETQTSPETISEPSPEAISDISPETSPKTSPETDPPEPSPETSSDTSSAETSPEIKSAETSPEIKSAEFNLTETKLEATPETTAEIKPAVSDPDQTASTADDRHPKASRGRGGWLRKGLGCLKEHQGAILTVVVIGASLLHRRK